MKLFICLASVVFLSNCASAQPTLPKKRDTLLWFIGIWQSRSVFRADSNYMTGAAVGGIVTIQPDGSTIAQSPGAQQFNQKIDQGVGAADGELNTLKQQISSEGLGQYRLYTYTREGIDSEKAWFQRQKLPESPSSGSGAGSPSSGAGSGSGGPSSGAASPSSPSASGLAGFCQAVHPDFDAVMQFYQAHRGTKHEHYDYPDPPRADYFNCWGCQHDAQKSFRAACDAYTEKFFMPEMDLLERALELEKQLTLLGRYGAADNSPDMQAINELFHRNKNDPGKNGPCAYLGMGDLPGAVAFLCRRIKDKAYQLLTDVDRSKDYNAVIPAVFVNIRAESVAERTMGGPIENAAAGEDISMQCGDLVRKLLNKLVDNLLSKHDWSYLADVPLMEELEATIVMLKGGQTDDLLLQQIINATHFTLSLDMNIGLDFQGHGIQTTHLKGDAKMVAEVDSLSCIRWVLSKTENGVITLNLLNNAMSLQQCSPQYTGTHTYTSALPELTIDLCKGGADTLTLTRFSPKPASAGTWNNPCGGPPTNSGINGADGYFMDPNTTVRQAQAIKSNSSAYTQQMQAMVAQLKQQGAAIRQQYNGGASGGTDNAATAESIKKMMDIGNTAMNSQITQMSRLVFPVTVTNKQTTLINQTINAMSVNTNPQVTQMIQYGTLTIQLKNTGN